VELEQLREATRIFGALQETFGLADQGEVGNQAGWWLAEGLAREFRLERRKETK
jgi:hypothetical protein